MANLHDWINSFLLLAIGIIMFSQKHIIEKMKSFFDIFDIEKVKTYVKMNEETAYMKAANLVADDAKMKKIMYDTLQEKVEDIKEVYLGQIKDEQLELVNFAASMLCNFDKTERDKIIDASLPLTKRYIVQICDDKEGNRL